MGKPSRCTVEACLSGKLLQEPLPARAIAQLGPCFAPPSLNPHTRSAEYDSKVAATSSQHTFFFFFASNDDVKHHVVADIDPVQFFIAKPVEEKRHQHSAPFNMLVIFLLPPLVLLVGLIIARSPSSFSLQVFWFLLCTDDHEGGPHQFGLWSNMSRCQLYIL